MKTTPKTPHVFAVPPRRRSRKPTTVGGVVGYVRVSTREQARTGYSIESQTADITKYAADRGLTLYGIHVDAGKSGELPPHRAPALNAAVSQAIQTGSAMPIDINRVGARFLRAVWIVNVVYVLLDSRTNARSNPPKHQRRGSILAQSRQVDRWIGRVRCEC